MGDITKKLMALFSGLNRAYGEYKLGDKKGVKQGGQANTVRQPVTEELWDKHLAGEQGLGIIPIRDDGTVLFAALDIDKYDLDLNLLEAKIREHGLPFLLGRTKSGGAHLYVFFMEASEAKRVRRKLVDLAAKMGFAGTEVFPKQDQLASQADIGNWINMPYFDASRTVRYIIHEGKAIGLEEFVMLAYKSRVSLEQFEAVKLKNKTQKDDLKDAPPCLRYYKKNGFPPGSLNNALFSLGVYARKRWPDAWERYVWLFNDKYMGPGTPSEVKGVIKSLDKKSYEYLCSQPPLVDACDKDKCHLCEYGIDDPDEDPGFIIDGITKIDSDPPVYYVAVAGERIHMESIQLLFHSKFSQRVFERINFIPPPIKQKRWSRLLNKKMAEATIIDAPDDASPHGQLADHVVAFCTGRAQAREQEELLIGKPWKDPKSHKVFFRGKDLMEYLQNHRFYDFKQRQVFSHITDGMDGGKKFFQIKGRGVNTWWVPPQEEQTEDFEIPFIPDEEF